MDTSYIIAGCVPEKKMKTLSGEKSKKKALPEKVLKVILWDYCRAIIRKRDGNTCFICGSKGLWGSIWHTGHFLPSAMCGEFLRYDIRNLHSSCYRCNIDLGGNGGLFYHQIAKIYGQDFVNQLIEDYEKRKDSDMQLTRKHYEKAIDVYRELPSWDKAKLLDYTKSYKGWPFLDRNVPM